MQSKYYALQYTDSYGFVMFASRDGNPIILKDIESAKTELDVYKAELEVILKGIPVTKTKWWFKKETSFTPLPEIERNMVSRAQKTLHVAEITMRPSINKVM